MSTATTPVKVVTYLKGLPPIKSYEPLITWSLIISLLPQYLKPPNLAEC